MGVFDSCELSGLCLIFHSPILILTDKYEDFSSLRCNVNHNCDCFLERPKKTFDPA